jgi:excisionase family DNA binding protein
MTRLKSREGDGGAQLDLPLEKSRPPLTKQQCEPITVRIPEAIRLTGIGRSKLYELIANGDVEIVKIGRCTLIPMTSLHALIERAKSRQASAWASAWA